VPDGTLAGYAVASVGDSVNLGYLGSKDKRGQLGKGIAHTLTASTMSQFTPQKTTKGKLTLRRLTPVECERLQGFSDNWTKFGQNGKAMSDTQRYKMCGNAVTVNVIQAVFERICECLIARRVAPAKPEQIPSKKTTKSDLRQMTYSVSPCSQCKIGRGLGL
jgi:DNA (cytosine-5)-methyltransferase 1